MKKIVTIDAGTSNLRIRIVEGKNIIFEKKRKLWSKNWKRKI